MLACAALSAIEAVGPRVRIGALRAAHRALIRATREEARGDGESSEGTNERIRLEHDGLP